MATIGSALHTLTLCLFFSASVLLIVELFSGEGRLFTIARNSVLAGFAVLTVLLLGRGIAFGYFPMFTFYETLLLLTWTATLAVVFLERNYAFRAVFHFAVPLLFAVLFFAFFFSAQQVEILPEFDSLWLYAHILTVIISYGTFAVAFITSVMYLLVDNHLKKKKLSSLITHLPSLDTLDLYIHKLVTVGFFLLTLSILLGAMWAQTVWVETWFSDPKVIWSVVTWIIYAAYLHTRLATGWQGRRVAMLNTLGFATVMFNYVVVRFFFASGLHQFY